MNGGRKATLRDRQKQSGQNAVQGNVSTEQRFEREERSVARVSLSCRLLFASGDVYEVQLLNLSYKGCRVGNVPVALDRATPVAVELPGLTEFTVGRVAWCDDGEMGVEFEAPLFEPVFRYLHDKLFGLEPVS